MSGDSSKTRLRETVTQAVDALPPDLRAPVLLRYREKFSYEEIARRLSLPDDGVRGRICAAALRLHAKFGMHLAESHAILAEPGMTTGDCRSIEKHIPRFVEQGAVDPESRTVEAHISKCRSCLEMVARFRAVWHLLQTTYQSAMPGPKDGVLRSPFAAPAHEENFETTFGLGALLGIPSPAPQAVVPDGPVDPVTAAAELAKMLGMSPPPPMPVYVERPAAAYPLIEIEPDPSSKVFDSTVTVTPLPVAPIAIELKIVPDTSPHVEPLIIKSPEPALPARETIALPVDPVGPGESIKLPPAVPISAPAAMANVVAPVAPIEMPVAPAQVEVNRQEKPASGPISFMDRMRQRMEGAPFWFVSLAFHGLLIALAALISMTIKPPFEDEKIIISTEFSKPLDTEEIESQVKMNLPSALTQHLEDVAERANSKVVIPEDVMARAEIGDHFETVNPELPDLHTAMGQEDAKIVDVPQGRVDAPGGGGENGENPGDLIGVGGSGSFGKGHGHGGGNGTGAGPDVGAGKGTFGQRDGAGRKLMVEKHGGSPATEGAVEKALQWLAARQEADGSWGSVHKDPVVFCTSIATLAFLGAGHTEKVGKYKENVVKAVAWLRNQSYQGRQLSNVYVRNGETSGYSLAALTMALSEAAGMADVKETRAAAQKAVNYCVDVHQGGIGSEKTAWRYQPRQDPDLSVSGWFIMALKSAKVAGLHVDPASFEGANRFISSVQSKVDVREFDSEYGPAFEYAYMPLPRSAAGFSVKVIRSLSTTECCQAIANLCRQFMGYKKADLQASVEYFVKRYGVPAAGKENLYYWYYGTLCTFQQGGDVWKQWNAAMQHALLTTQELDGNNAGSWTPAGPYGADWGRVGQTAISALCLEVYYRYSRLVDDK